MWPKNKRINTNRKNGKIQLRQNQNSQSSISIPPRPVYHPAINQACQAMFGKHPTSLTPEEVSKFKIYQRQKLKNNDPIENDVIYQPIGGIRTCIQCGNLTWTSILWPHYLADFPHNTVVCFSTPSPIIMYINVLLRWM